ncbi:MAG TPA: PP2C family protein-serine/threonine phosphatase [Candidatus Limnocylindria bacterium]|nr:PP2C family protein-serine/threonine phosphatase [Candidatus Limnocylindria bacterium]
MTLVAQSAARLHVSDAPIPAFPPPVRLWSRVRGTDGGRLCGDVIVAEPLPGGRLALVVGDVLGHGWSHAAPAAFIAERVVSMLALGCSPGLALLAADDAFRAVADACSFAAIFVADVDPRCGVVRYSSAGHDAAIVLGAEGAVRGLEANGPLLGVVEDPQFGEGQFTIEAGLRLVVVTDGVVESRPPGTVDFFGTERVLRSASWALCCGADPAAALIEDVVRHAGGVPSDDAAALVAAW